MNNKSALANVAYHASSEENVLPSQGEATGTTASSRAIVRRFLESLDERNVRYCHWKSNIRLQDALEGAEDIDLLVDRRDSDQLHFALAENEFKIALSSSGIGHPAVFHALGLDEETAGLVHLHIYFQIVSGDSLVKSYRFPVEGALLEHTRRLHGVSVPVPEAELVLFSLRVALKHVSLIETFLVSRHYRSVSAELAWLQGQADMTQAEALCTAWFPSIEPDLFRALLMAIQEDSAILRRILLGWRVAKRLSSFRRIGTVSGFVSRQRRTLLLGFGRFIHRKDMILQTGGVIVALVGPKATGKSTLGHELASRLGKNLDVRRIHAGKPPSTWLTIVPRLLTPLARSLFPSERPGEYERLERRRERRYSLLYILRMTILAYERRKLLRQALRAATTGSIVISDRYPSHSIGAIDSSCFGDAALAGSGSELKRWLMKREQTVYKTLPRPDLVIRLMAPIETAIERDATRLKEGGPDLDAVQRRWDMETQADFSPTPVIPIDTNRPLDETIRAVVKAVWAAF